MYTVPWSWVFRPGAEYTGVEYTASTRGSRGRASWHKLLVDRQKTEIPDESSVVLYRAGLSEVSYRLRFASVAQATSPKGNLTLPEHLQWHQPHQWHQRSQ